MGSVTSPQKCGSVCLDNFCLFEHRHFPSFYKPFVFFALVYTVNIMVKVDVEYCGKCNFEWQCKMLQNFLQDQKPDTEMECHKGRQGSFEVRINDTLVHSKLQSLAFPDHQSVLENVKRAEQGQPLEKAKEQPIDNCTLM